MKSFLSRILILVGFATVLNSSPSQAADSLQLRKLKGYCDNFQIPSNSDHQRHEQKSLLISEFEQASHDDQERLIKYNPKCDPHSSKFGEDLSPGMAGTLIRTCKENALIVVGMVMGCMIYAGSKMIMGHHASKSIMKKHANPTTISDFAKKLAAAIPTHPNGLNQAGQLLQNPGAVNTGGQQNNLVDLCKQIADLGSEAAKRILQEAERNLPTDCR